MGFPAQFVGWIKVCVSSVMYSVVINGELLFFFPAKWGLRLGDPMSPCPFLIVMECFYSMLQQRVREGGFTFHQKCQALNLEQLAFVDDLFILCGADRGSFQIVQCVLSQI